MLKNLFFLIGIALFSMHCTPMLDTSTTFDGIAKNDYPPNAQPGKCYAKAKMPDKYSVTTIQVLEYTGNDKEENVNVEMQRIVVQPASSKWVKKRADSNCLSPNSDDCLVWCLVESEEESIQVRVLLDTAQTKNFVVRNIEKRDLLKAGGQTEWVEVLCSNKTTSNIIQQIQAALMANGYQPGQLDGLISVQTKAALTQFQKDNNLPVGSLDFDSLDMLGVDY